MTKLLTSEPTWGGFLRGMLVLAAVWWAWTTYAWLTSAIDVDEGAVRLTMLASTAIMLGVALAVPRAFGADAVLFGVAYLLVRLIHFVLSAVVGRDDLVRRGVLLRFAPTSYLHLPMVAGIVLFALGLKATLHHVGTELDTLPAVGLCAGAALYLLAHIAFLWRTTGRVFRRRTAGASLLLALIPAAVAIPALAALALVSGVCSLVVAYEAIRYRDSRVRVRHPDLVA